MEILWLVHWYCNAFYLLIHRCTFTVTLPFQLLRKICNRFSTICRQGLKPEHHTGHKTFRKQKYTSISFSGSFFSMNSFSTIRIVLQMYLIETTGCIATFKIEKKLLQFNLIDIYSCFFLVKFSFRGLSISRTTKILGKQFSNCVTIRRTALRQTILHSSALNATSDFQ